MTRLVFARTVPPEIREAVTPHVERWAWLLPSWCLQLDIDVGPADGEQTILDVNLQYEYRRAKLRIYPAWFNETEEERELDIAHEFTHVVLAPMTDFTAALLEKACAGNEQLLHWARDEFRKSVESTTCDLSEALFAARPLKKGRKA